MAVVSFFQYMDQLLQRGESFEFFLEGGRTRSGKALYPKGGLLSVVVDSFREGTDRSYGNVSLNLFFLLSRTFHRTRAVVFLRAGNIDDVCLVPVGISYEKIMDGNFVAEQMVRSQKR